MGRGGRPPWHEAGNDEHGASPGMKPRCAMELLRSARYMKIEGADREWAQRDPIKEGEGYDPCVPFVGNLTHMKRI